MSDNYSEYLLVNYNMLWNDLVQKNYINKKGFITDNFALLTNYD